MKKSILATVILLLSAGVAGAQTPAASDKAEALAAAARKGDAAMVATLLDQGIDVNTRFRYGVTALSYAADHGQLDVVKVLLARGALVNVKDTFYGATPLVWATTPAMTRKPAHAEIVGLLLKHGAEGKDAALQSAVTSGESATTKVILDHGGLSPSSLADALDAATRAKRPDIVTLLERAGAKPHPELKMDDTELARYAGAYRASSGTELVVVVASGRLTLGAGKSGSGPPQPLPLVARSQTAFVGADAPALRVTFTLENGKVTALTLGPAGAGTTYVRVEDKAKGRGQKAKLRNAVAIAIVLMRNR